MTPEQQAQDIVQQLRTPAGERADAPPENHATVEELAEGTREEVHDALQREEAANGEQTSLDGNSALTFASDVDFEKVLELFWNDVRFRATPREHVGDRTIIVPTEVIERLRKENIPFEVRKVARAGDVSQDELSRIRYKNGVMTGLI
jgi:hypothetical protein